MKKMVVPILTAFLLLISSTSASAQQSVWASPNGSNRNPGTKHKPVKTLVQARNLVRQKMQIRPNQNFTVILKGGVYRIRKPLLLKPNDSGRGRHAITYRSATNQRAIIDGGRRINKTSWQSVNGTSLYRTKVGNVNTREFYVNGRRATRARTASYPSGFLPSWNNSPGNGGIEYLPTIKPDGLNSSKWGNPQKWTNVADIEAVVLTQWKQMSVPLKSVTANQGNTPGMITMQQPAWNNANVFRGPDGKPGPWSMWQITYFENALQFLDHPGEWYLDRSSGWLYYMPRPWENMRAIRTQLPLAGRLINGVGKPGQPVRNIQFKRIAFRNATWNGPSSNQGYVSDQGGFFIRGKNHQPNQIGHDPNVIPTPGAIAFNFSRGITFKNNYFRQIGQVAVKIGRGSQNNTVEGNSFVNVGSSAITLGGVGPDDSGPPNNSYMTKNNLISKNMINLVGNGYADAPGIYAGFSSNTVISDNEVSNVPWTGIASGWGWGLIDRISFPGLPGATAGMWDKTYTRPTSAAYGNLLIARNKVSDYNQKLWDGGAVYMNGSQGTKLSTGATVAHNTFYNKDPNSGTNTIYTDGGARYVNVVGNTSFNNPIGRMNFGPPPKKGDPLPYNSLLSDSNLLPYGSEIGGCRTRGDISYRNNNWFQPPIRSELPLYNDIYDVLSGGKLKPYSDKGFFNVCPYSNNGVNYPTNLSFKNNTIYDD